MNLVVHADTVSILGTLSNAGKDGDKPSSSTDASRHAFPGKSIKLVARKLICGTDSCTIETRGEPGPSPGVVCTSASHLGEGA